MSFELPSREALLAASTPETLFGGLLDEPRSLRFAWAQLAKAFRADEDPEAFQHARALYDAAREAAERHRGGAGDASASIEEGGTGPERGGASETTARSVVAASPPREESLGPNLVAAVNAHDWQEVVNVLSTQSDTLVQHHPAALAHALDELVGWVGPRLGPGALDQVTLLVERPDLDLPPDLAERLERDLVALRALANAERDTEVPPILLELVGRVWYARGDRVAAASLGVAEALAELRLDPGPGMWRLVKHHPALVAVLQWAWARMAGDAAKAGVPSLPAEVRGPLRARVDPSVHGDVRGDAVHIAATRLAWPPAKVVLPLLLLGLLLMSRLGLGTTLAVVFGTLVVLTAWWSWPGSAASPRLRRVWRASNLATVLGYGSFLLCWFGVKLVAALVLWAAGIDEEVLRSTVRAAGWVGAVGGWVVQSKLHPRVTRYFGGATEEGPTIDALAEVARAHGLFPDELVAQLVPDEAVPLRTDEGLDDAWPGDNPLLRFQRDPAEVLRVMTAAHHARVAGWWEAEAARAAAAEPADG